MYVRTYVCVYIYLHIYLYIHIHIYVCIYIYVYICIYVRNGGGTHDAPVSRRRASCGRRGRGGAGRTQINPLACAGAGGAASPTGGGRAWPACAVPATPTRPSEARQSRKRTRIFTCIHTYSIHYTDIEQHLKHSPHQKYQHIHNTIQSKRRGTAAALRSNR